MATKKVTRRTKAEKQADHDPAAGVLPEGSGGRFEDDDIKARAAAEIASRAAKVRREAANNGHLADDTMTGDVSRLAGPLVVRLAGVKDELVEQFPEADLAGLVTQLRHSLIGCPAAVYESNLSVGVHAGEVTPQTIEALTYVIERLLQPAA